MKIYTKETLKKNNKLIWKVPFELKGKIQKVMGIHYDYKSTRSAKLMEKQAKREKKLLERKAKREAKEGPKKDANSTNTLDPNKPLDLDFLTNPEKKQNYD